MYQECIDLLEERGVRVEDIADCVVFLQYKYIDNLDQHMDTIIEAVKKVIEKREVQHAVLTGIYIDKGVEAGTFASPSVSGLIAHDAGLYGIDEVLAYGICNLYGSIALTNFGYIDKVKPGIIGELNAKDSGHCHTFLDDIVGAIAAAAASRFAHNQK